MPRLMIIALVVAGVAARAVAVPDQAAAAPVDLERDQRAELFDDALEAEPLLAPDHAAAAEEALARDDPYLAVEPTREVEPEVTDERAGGGVEAAAEAAEALDEAEPLLAPDHATEAEALAADKAAGAHPCGVTDDELGPLVAKVARGPSAENKAFNELATDVAHFAQLRTSTSEDVVDYVRWGAPRYDDAAAWAHALSVDPHIDEKITAGTRNVEPDANEATTDGIDETIAADAGAVKRIDKALNEIIAAAPELYAPTRRSDPTSRDDDDDDETIAAEAVAKVDKALNEFIAKAPELYGLMRRTELVDDAPDDDLGGLFKLVKGLGGRLKFEDDKEPLRAPDLEYNAYDDDEVERAAQVGYVGPRCTDCTCRSWDGKTYADCRPTTAADPCDGYCAKCEADGETPMPGHWTMHAWQCERYEGLGDGVVEGEIEEVTTMIFFRASILEETYQAYATDPAAKAAITNALVAAGVAVPGEVIEVAWTLITDGRGIMPQRAAAVVRLYNSPSDRIFKSTVEQRVRAAVGTPRATPLGNALADVRVHRPSTPAATLRALAAALDYDVYPRPAQRVPEEPFAYQTIPFAFGGRPPYALPDSYPRWFKVLYRQPWILWYQVSRYRIEFDPVLCMMALSWLVLAIAGFAVGRAVAPTAAARKEAPAPDSLAALARENHGDLAEKGMSPYVTPRGRGGAVRLTAAPMPVMPSPASVSEQDY